MTSGKVCSKCGVEKPLEEFARHPRGALGRQSRCKPCLVEVAAALAERRALERSSSRFIFPTTKTCTHCGEEKVLADFGKTKSTADGHLKACKVCKNKESDVVRERAKAKKASADFVYPESKVCKMCGESKPADAFAKNPGYSDGLLNLCKVCDSHETAARRAQVVAEKKKRGVVATDAKQCSCCKETKDASAFSPDLRASSGLQSECKECSAVTARSRAALLTNEEYLVFRRTANENNRRYLARQQQRSKAGELVPRGTEYVFLRNTLKRVFTATKQQKSSKAEIVLGYTTEQLRKRIETNFQPGMDWTNAGKWHIDHVIPMSHFLKRGETRPHIINALCNLRPLWAAENLAKNCKLPSFLERKQQYA